MRAKALIAQQANDGEQHQRERERETLLDGSSPHRVLVYRVFVSVSVANLLQ